MKTSTKRTGGRPGRTSRAVVGLDIGASAVRAVELAGHAGRRKVVAAAQVGLHPGTVVDGEVGDSAALAAALRRLWAEGGFSTTRVVVAVAGQRVIVREAEVSAMSADDFRTAMSFEVQDLIPIASAEALLDFKILGPAAPTASGHERMRILLTAADRQSVGRLLEVLAAAGLEAAAVDVGPAALLRAAAVDVGQGVGIVTVGANLTNVLRSTDDAFFSRTLAVGAASLSRGLGVRLGIEPAEAEAVKRYAGTGQRGSARAAVLVTDEARPLVEQIVESFDFFHSQGRTDELDRIVVTGGGALTVGLVDSLAEQTGAEVTWLDPFRDLDTSGLALEAADLARFRATAATATGLALWADDPSGHGFNLLPAEVIAARARRKATVACASGVAVLITALAGLGYVRHQQIGDVRTQVAAANREATGLQQADAALAGVDSYESAVSARRATLSGVAASIDWPKLVAQIQSYLPGSQFTITSMTLSAASTAGSGQAQAAPAATGKPATLGTIAMSVTATGGSDAVATWLRLMAKVPSLAAVSVPGDTLTTQGTTTFTCTAVLTDKSPMVTYSWEAKK